MKRNQISRRDFLRVAGITGGMVATGALIGWRTIQSVSGDPIPNLSPYTDSTELGESSGAGLCILMVSGDTLGNPLAVYLHEILTTEGFTGFHYLNASQESIENLEAYDLVLLAQSVYEQGQVEQFLSYVLNGGKLVVFRPELALQKVMGIKPEGKLSNGYIRIDKEFPRGNEIFEDSVQFHGEADCYQLLEWDIYAWLADSPMAETWHPAVFSRSIGLGRVIVWAYDLASSVALTRQGNPAWVNQERDGREGIRAVDSFVDWVDLERLSIPQADVQMRFLSRLMTDLLADQYPLPRIWYFPEAVKTVLIVTGDAHQSPAWAIDEVFRTVEKYGGTMTVYYTPPPSTSLLKRVARRARMWVYRLPVIGKPLRKNYYHPLPDQVSAWRKRGHEFALHPFVEEGLEVGWEQYWEQFTGLGFGPVPPTVRTHQVLWQGWVETARLQATYGIRLNLDYYPYGPALKKENGEWAYGYLTGSGLAMKFIDKQGRLLNINQQLTQLVDEQVIKMPWGLGGANIGGQAGAEVAKELLERSLREFPAAICGQFHVDPFAIGGELAEEEKKFLEGTLMYAKANGIPIISANKWLEFLSWRRELTINDVKFNERESKLQINVVSPERGAWTSSLLIPERKDSFLFNIIEVNGTVVESTSIFLAGTDYRCVNLPSGPVSVVISFTKVFS